MGPIIEPETSSQLCPQLHRHPAEALKLPTQVWWVSHTCTHPFLQDEAEGRVYFLATKYLTRLESIQVRVRRSLLLILAVWPWPPLREVMKIKWVDICEALTGHIVQKKDSVLFRNRIKLFPLKWSKRWCGNIPSDHPFIQQVLLEDILCFLTDQVQKLLWVHKTQANGLQTVTW